MGKVEKVIVLSVLFLIALILVVSFTVEDPLKKDKVVNAGKTPVANPMADALANPALGAQQPGMGLPLSANGAQVPAGGAQVPAGGAQVPAGGAQVVATLPNAPQQQPGLLSTNVTPNVSATNQPLGFTPQGTPLAAAAPVLPPNALLKSLDGLEDSYLPEMKFYTWKDGDTWRSIAGKYYGDPAKLLVLRKSNEGRVDVKAGQKIFVPVFDSNDAATLANVKESLKAETAGAKSAPTIAKSEAKSADGGKTHVVKEGESLWKIAAAELGKGSRWMEIYEANKDVLKKPEAQLKKGMKLRIP